MYRPAEGHEARVMAEDLTSNYILENSDEPVQDAETVRNTETRPVAIMFTDIEGSTAYYEEHGDVAGREMIETHNSILFPIITTHNGMIVRTMGDGLMACFERPESSVRAAIAMQMALLEHNEAHPETVDQIHVRIGLNCGDALVELSEEGTIRDVHGDVVNTASRVETGLDRQADEILVSKSVERAVFRCGKDCNRVCECRGCAEQAAAAVDIPCDLASGRNPEPPR